MTHERYKFLGVLGNLRRKDSCNKGFFLFGRATEILFITKILAAGELRSNVTITLRDKSRYDLVVKINEKA